MAGVAIKSCVIVAPASFLRGRFEIQLAPSSPVVTVVPQFHPPAAAVFLF
jgi:hypothetical protein